MKQISTLKREFFEAFNIPADKSETAYFTGHYNEYPEITDTIILELICIYNRNIILEDRLIPHSIESIRNAALMRLIEDRHKGQIYKEVRKLFGITK